jgi:HTH-type transcriptional regulator/antitoxin HigA
MPASAPPPLYLKLIRKFPLRPIRSDEELERAVDVSLGLDVRRDSLTPEERDYHEVLVALIGLYEDEVHPIPDVSGPEMLRFLIEDRGVTQADVARGTQIKESAVSEMLAGKRPMGLKMIETLARYFGVAPALVLPRGASTSGAAGAK